MLVNRFLLLRRRNDVWLEIIGVEGIYGTVTSTAGRSLLNKGRSACLIRRKSVPLSMGKGGCIYIMTNKSRTTLYVGVTSDLQSRINQHKTRFYPTSFTARYNLYECIYYEHFSSIEEAIMREKEVKKWRREKKEFLINTINPDWKDLWDKIEKW